NYEKLLGLNGRFPSRIQNPAAIEWVEDQLAKQDANLQRQSGLERLRDNLRRTEERVATEKKTVLSNREYAMRPQPVHYGLTYDDVHPGRAAILGFNNDGLQYKKGRRWFGILGGWKFFLAIWLVTYAIALALVSSNIGAVRDFFNVSRPYRSPGLTLGGAIIVGFLVTLYVFVVLN